MDGSTELKAAKPHYAVTASFRGTSFAFHHFNDADHIIRQIRNSGRFYEEELLAASSAYLKKGDLVLDIGANIGNHAVFFGGVLGCKVIAFEPNPDAIDLLKANIDANDLDDQIEVMEVGLGARKGKAYLSNVEGNLGATSLELGGRGKVEIRTLDSIELPASPRLLKIDVEGMELDVLKGARKTVAAHQPVICCEIATHKNIAEVRGLLEPLGYVSLESFCYTPTHFFIHVGDDQQLETTLSIVSRLASNIALNHFEADARLARIHRLLQGDFGKVEKQLTSQISGLRSTIETLVQSPAQEALASDLAVVLSQLESLQSAAGHLGPIERSLSDISSKLSSVETLETDVGSFGTRLDQQATQFASEVRDSAQELFEQLRPLIEPAGASLSPQVDKISSQLESAEQMLDQRFGAIEASINQVNLDLLPHVQAFEGTISASEQRLVQKVESVKASIGTVGAAIPGQLSSLESSIEATGKQVGEQFDAIQDSLAETRNSLPEHFGNLAGRVDAVSSSLVPRLESLETLVDEVRSGTEINLASRFDALKGSLSDVEARLLPLFGEIQGAQEETASAVRKAVRDSASSIRRTIRTELDHRSEETAELLDNMALSMVKRFLPSFNELGQQQTEMVEALRSADGTAFAAAGALVSRQKDELPADPPPCLRPDYEAEPASICFTSFRFERNWEQWRHHQSVNMSDPGTFVSKQYRSTPGVESPSIHTVNSGLYQVRIKSTFDAGFCRPFIRVVAAGTNELLGPDFRLSRGETVFRFYQPERIDTIQLKILLEGPAQGSTVTLHEVSLERVDMESHQRWVSRQIGAPVIASMATIPSRTRMLKDAVYTLLLQCDEVRVYMNNYETVPDFLDHPRIRIRRSQHWDDNGDAGKFGWVDDNDAPGYRVICDDDLLFPPDLIERLAGKVQETEDRAMVGLHGVMLRQPITQYYAPNSRHAVHFQSRMDSPKLVQILATCVMCYHSSQMKLKRDDFMFRNMADVWLSAYAKDNGIPLMIIDRPFKWVRQNTQEGGFETIYENSLKRTKSNFDSSYIQDAVLKSVAPLTLQKLDRDFHAMIVGTDSKEALDAFLKNFDQNRDHTKEWLIILALTGQSDELREYVQTMPFAQELHIVDPPSRDPQDVAVALSELLSKLHYDMAFFATDRLRFSNDDWCRLPVEEEWLSKADFLAFECEGKSIRAVALPDRWTDFCIFSKRAEADFAEAGKSGSGPDGRDPVSALKSFLPGMSKDAKSRMTGAPPLVTTLAARALRSSITDTDPEGGLAPIPIAAPSIMKTRRGSRSVNDVFDRVVVLNLDRRPDRWDSAKQRLDDVGVEAERFRAVDGSWPEVAEEYREYVMTPLRDFGKTPGKLGRTREFYLYAKSESQRTAFLEQRDNFKAIARPGAWGYLKSMIGILEAAITDGVENLLVFDDDIILHRRFNEIFSEAMDELPDDWRILQLGTLQYDWDRRWLQWFSEHLYSSLGGAVGSHAVGLRREILPFLLERSKRMEMPYDIGPLSAAVRANKTRNFIIYPNIAIQDMADSDISSSTYQERARLEQVFDQYRWDIDDYEF